MKVTKLFVIGSSIGLVILILSYFILDHFQEPHRLDATTRGVAPGKFVELSEGMVHYEIHGAENAELVILIHGGGVTGCHVWSKTIPVLVESGYRVLCYDLYGRGYSDRPHVKYTPELLYKQFSELLDVLKVKEPFHLFGQSMGAMVASQFTAENPQRVKKLVYIAPFTLGTYPHKPYLKVPVVSHLLMTFYWYPRSINTQMEEFYSPEGMGEYRERLDYFMEYEGYKYSNLSTWINTLTVSVETSLELIGKQNTKTLLVLGEADPYIPVHSAEEYRRLIPNIQVNVVSETGHMPHYEAPEEVNATIIRFLK